MFNRVQVVRGSESIVQKQMVGDGISANLGTTIQASDSNQTITANAIGGGLYVRNGMTAGRTDTTDTALNILAANAGMDNGDSFLLVVSVSTAFALTLAGGAGVTFVAGGKTSIPASSFGLVQFIKTSDTTMQMRIL